MAGRAPGGRDRARRGGGWRHPVPDLLRAVPRRRRRRQGTGLVAHRCALAPDRAGARLLRRLHLQHHPLRPRRHAALWRQGVPAQRAVGHRQSRAQAAGADPAGARAGQRRRRHSAGAERHRLDRSEAPMSPNLRDRLVQRSLAGRYELFLGLGGGLAVLGFIFALMAADRIRVWQMVHVNWLFFTSLSAGSVAFVAVQKITNAKWSGMILRFASASVAFLPVSLLVLILLFTAGYTAVFGPMNAQLPALQHGKAVWLSHG